MKITKLPNALDPTFLIEQKILEENSVCPYCGERSKWSGAYTWYGKMNWKLKSLLAKSHNWRIDHYKCHNCGAEWDTDPYPTDITGLR